MVFHRKVWEGMGRIFFGENFLSTDFILFTLENSLHYRNQNDIVTGNESLPIRNW
jgi:hypothetical protein